MKIALIVGLLAVIFAAASSSVVKQAVPTKSSGNDPQVLPPKPSTDKNGSSESAEDQQKLTPKQPAQPANSDSSKQEPPVAWKPVQWQPQNPTVLPNQGPLIAIPPLPDFGAPRDHDPVPLARKPNLQHPELYGGLVGKVEKTKVPTKGDKSSDMPSKRKHLVRGMGPVVVSHRNGIKDNTLAEYQQMNQQNQKGQSQNKQDDWHSQKQDHHQQWSHHRQEWQQRHQIEHQSGSNQQPSGSHHHQTGSNQEPTGNEQ